VDWGRERPGRAAHGEEPKTDVPKPLETEIAFRRSAFARDPVWLLNSAAASLEAHSARLRNPIPGSLIPNLHVAAIA
jgi:hypothetical protein